METIMFITTRIALSAAVVLGAASAATRRCSQYQHREKLPGSFEVVKVCHCHNTGPFDT